MSSITIWTGDSTGAFPGTLVQIAPVQNNFSVQMYNIAAAIFLQGTVPLASGTIYFPQAAVDNQVITICTNQDIAALQLISTFGTLQGPDPINLWANNSVSYRYSQTLNQWWKQ